MDEQAISPLLKHVKHISESLLITNNVNIVKNIAYTRNNTFQCISVNTKCQQTQNGEVPVQSGDDPSRSV